MAQIMKRILKSDEVEVEGEFHLDLNQTVSHSPAGRAAALGPATARIVENQNDFVSLEITCPCGRKTIVRCEYSANKGQAAPKTGENKSAKKP